MGLAIDAVNNLYVADQANNRVLKFNEGSSPGNEVANAVGGRIDASHGAPNYVDAIGENSAGGIAVDALTGAPHRHVYVADTINNRVLGSNDVSSFTTARPAISSSGSPTCFHTSATTAWLPATWQDSARTACAVRRGWRWIAREICTSPMRATTRACVQHAVQRGQRRAGRGRYVGGFRLRPGWMFTSRQRSGRRGCNYA